MNDVRLRYCGACHLWHDDLGLAIWVITVNPADYPDQYVVRQQFAGRMGVMIAREPEAVAATLEIARDVLPDGLTYFPRQPEDDPVIVETWL